VLTQIDLGKSAVRDVPLPRALEPPPFARFGDWTLLVQLLIAGALAWLLTRRQAQH
jgi:apolipoprotein N-acyltransferase